jgi:hypothetical protein
MAIDLARYAREFASLQFLGFKLADAREGLAAARAKRRSAFGHDQPE